MAFWNLDVLKLEQFRPGIMSRAETGSNLIMVCMEISPGREDSGHAHPFDQCGIVIDGEIEMFVKGEHKILKQNETYFIPSGERHGWKTMEKGVKILDISLKQPQ